MEEQARVPHKPRKTGGKVRKKQQREKKTRHNPKAFGFSGGINSVRQRVQRSLDIQAKREHAKLVVDKTPEENAPPWVVCIQGPSGVGKSTLIRSLVKHYTRHSVGTVRGPITLVSTRSRRLTFVECPNSFTAMVDVAKVADLVLLLIDASYGFEMETFEFLNILQVHGFPRVIGVLTHLDSFAESKAQRRVKKQLKNRFWAEIYSGAKLFYFSGLQHGRYNKTEVANLSRFIAVQKLAPLSFRSQRPYILALRCEDQEAVEEESRTVHLYGYLKGSNLRNNGRVHIPGAGDYCVESVEKYLDPCPVPRRGAAENQGDAGRSLRTLKPKEKCLYAPQCDVGNLNYEPDAVYIHLPDHQVGFTRRAELMTSDSEKEGSSVAGDAPGEESADEAGNATEAVHLVRALQNAEEQFERTVESQSLKLLPTSASAVVRCSKRRRPIPSSVAGDLAHSDDDGELKPTSSDSRAARAISDVDTACAAATASEAEAGSDAEAVLHTVDTRGRRNVVHQEILERFRCRTSLANLVYGSLLDPTDRNVVNDANSSKTLLGNRTEAQEAVESGLLSDTALYRSVAGVEAANADAAASAEAADAEAAPQGFWSKRIVRQLKNAHFITGGWDGEKPEEQEDKAAATDDSKKTPTPTVEELQAQFMREKAAAAAQAEEEKNLLKEAQTVASEGAGVVIVGTYVRIVIKGMPPEWVEFVRNNGAAPIIVGGLLPGESDTGMMQARIKRHRWAPKILKTNDPVMVSVGWRRFQTLPLYCIEDRNNVRVRMLKYTPEHLHCLAAFYGPICAPQSGVLVVRNWDKNLKAFRVSATGVVLEVAPTFTVVKKLKLVGEPMRIMKNTAFIKKMFSSDLEVAKCIGCKIQTVSGVRGQIKKAHGSNGAFRATFEDKILMSDLVICKTWIRVEPKEFFNPVLDVPGWRRLRTMVEIRHDLQLPGPDSRVSEYGSKPERPTRRFNRLKIPKSLESTLPFASRLKLPAPHRTPKDAELAEATKPLMSDFEKTVANVFIRLNTMVKAKEKARAGARANYRAAKAAEEAKSLQKKSPWQKEQQKRRSVARGKVEARERKRLRIGE